jgi:hypothetical protein
MTLGLFPDGSGRGKEGKGAHKQLYNLHAKTTFDIFVNCIFGTLKP